MRTFMYSPCRTTDLKDFQSFDYPNDNRHNQLIILNSTQHNKRPVPKYRQALAYRQPTLAQTEMSLDATGRTDSQSEHRNVRDIHGSHLGCL